MTGVNINLNCFGFVNLTCLASSSQTRPPSQHAGGDGVTLVFTRFSGRSGTYFSNRFDGPQRRAIEAWRDTCHAEARGECPVLNARASTIALEVDELACNPARSRIACR